MAAGRSSGVVGAAASAEFSSTRTRVSLSARGSPITTTTSSSSAVESSTSVLRDAVAGSLDERDEQAADNANDDDEANPVATASGTEASERDDDDAAAVAHDSEDDNEWEDIEYDEPVFRDLAFPDDDDAAAEVSDSEYAPSEAIGESEDEDDASDLDDEEEEASAAGLFASVLQRFSRRKRRASSAPGDPLDDASAFTDADRMCWTSADAKAQWAARFQAANTQFVHTYGCRIDSPALPEANAKLRREKKKRSAYALVLFALCVAYFVQLVVMYAATTPAASLSLGAVSGAIASVATAVASVWHQLHVLAPRDQSDAIAVETAAPVRPVESESVVIVAIKSSSADDGLVVSVSSVEASESETESETKSEPESPHAAVELCGKFLTRFVKSQQDASIRDSAVRACDVAVALAPLASTPLVEAHVLRGDLYSLISAFDDAAADYDRAVAAYASLSTPRAALADELELKTRANRWIQLLMQKRSKELRREVAQAAKRSDSSAPLQTLAADWLQAFKRKKTLADVLTATRQWTLQRLVYSE